MIEMNDKIEDISEAETKLTLNSIRMALPQIPRLFPIVDSSLVDCEPSVEEPIGQSPDLARDEKGRLFLLGNLETDSLEEALTCMGKLCRDYLRSVDNESEVEIVVHWYVAMLFIAQGHFKIEIEHPVTRKLFMIYFSVECGIEPKIFVVRERNTQ